MNTFTLQKGELTRAYVHSPFKKGEVPLFKDEWKVNMGGAPFEGWTLDWQILLNTVFLQNLEDLRHRTVPSPCLNNFLMIFKVVVKIKKGGTVRWWHDMVARKRSKFGRNTVLINKKRVWGGFWMQGSLIKVFQGP